jgi:hypothetical protein
MYLGYAMLWPPQMRSSIVPKDALRALIGQPIGPVTRALAIDPCANHRPVENKDVVMDNSVLA